MPWYADPERSVTYLATIIDCPIARIDGIGSWMAALRSILSRDVCPIINAITTLSRAICSTDCPLESTRLMIAIDGGIVPRATKTRSIAQIRKVIMPLLRFDLIEGRPESELKKILD